MPAKTLLLIPVPTLTTVVNFWRERCKVPAPANTPAHITLLNPFVKPKDLTAKTISQIAEVVATYSLPTLTLDTVATFPSSPHQLLHLRLDNPTPVVALVEALCQVFGTLSYEGLYDKVIPHVSVSWGPRTLLDEARSELLPLLPVSFKPTVSLYLQPDSTHRVLLATF